MKTNTEKYSDRFRKNKQMSKNKETNIKVSILCITYNQEKFIKQALNSFITQKTNFNFEIIVGDDCSKDNTPIIIKEFENKYPNIIKPIYRNKNVGISNNLFDILQKATGQYISLCAGDDYFTNENKLQIQANFLDKNPDYSMCFHLTKVFFEKNEEKETLFPDLKKVNKFSIEELLKDNFLQANSVMYRNLTYKNLPTDIIPEDWYLHLYHAKFGKIGFINKIMSAYRRHEGSVLWNTYKNAGKVIEKQEIKQFKMYLELLKLFNNKNYIEIINHHIDEFLNHIIKVDRNNNNTKLIKELFNKYPNDISKYLIKLNQSFNDLQIKQNECVLKLNEYVLKSKQIESSNFFKLWRKYCKIKDIFKK